MQSDPRTSYLDAHNTFIQARAVLADLMAPAGQIVSALGRTWDVEFGKMAAISYALQDVVRQAQSQQVVDLAKWPTAEQIEAGVRDCKQNYAAMTAAWANVPEDKRSGLTPPQKH